MAGLHLLLMSFETFLETILKVKSLTTVQMLKDSITDRGWGLKQVDLWRFSAWSSHLLYVLQPLPLRTQSQQRHGILFHTTSSSVTQLDLKLFLFLRLLSVKAGGLQLCNKKHIQCNSAGLSLDSYTALLAWRIKHGLTELWVCYLFMHVHTVHFLCARAKHDEWAEWSVKAVFSLITLRCLIRARVCSLSLAGGAQYGLVIAMFQKKNHNQADVGNTSENCFL